MRILTKKTLNTFTTKHSVSKTSVNEWYLIVTLSTWGNLNELKETFPYADYVGNDRFVFNVGGNNYRIVAIVRFNISKVFIRFIGTHAEYENI